jgi:5-formyltetrahydrofolate cyclo-ligase
VSPKQLLRRQIIAERQALSEQEWQQKSLRLCHHLQNLPLFQNARTILAYFSFKKEPNLEILFHTYFQQKWGFPRCVDQELIWHSWQPGDNIKKGKHGVSEPDFNLPLIEPEEVDLILVPTVACDYQGFRLGYGAGYYDRMLSKKLWQSIPTIGIVFEEYFYSEIPQDQWDQKLDFICTDLRITKTNI